MTTLTRTSALILTAATLAACAKHGLIAGPVAGDHIKGTFVHGEPSPAREEYLRIDPQSFTKIVVCRDGENVARLEVTAPAHVTASTVQIIRPALKVERVGNIDCVAKIDVFVADYAIDQHHRLSLHEKSGWRKHYVLVGPASPGVWQQIREGARKLGSKIKHAGHEARAAVRRASDVYIDIKMRQAKADADLAEHVYQRAKKLAKKATPGSK